jgi:hypothetical protein
MEPEKPAVRPASRPAKLPGGFARHRTAPARQGERDPRSRNGSRALIAMLEIAISLIVGFVLGYGVRGWAFRQSSDTRTRRRPF